MIKNRIVARAEVPPEELTANEQNWRRHPPAQQAALLEALNDIGWIKSVTVNRLTGRVVDGHLRVELALRENVKTVPVDYVELTPEEEALALATVDPIAGMAETDKEKLQLVLDAAALKDEKASALLSVIENLRGVAPGPLGVDVGDEEAGGMAVEEFAPVSQVRMVQLFFTGETEPVFSRRVADLAGKLGMDNISDTVFEVVRQQHVTSITKDAAETDRVSNP